MQTVAAWIFRVRLWWLWLASSFRFRWAHRPLCRRFREDVVSVGGVYLCRSCVCAYCGLLMCGAFIAAMRPSVTATCLTLVSAALVTLALSGPWCYKKLPRTVRDALRWSMGGMIALVGYLFICRELIIALPAVLVFWAFWRFYLGARRKRKMHTCDGCEELASRAVCSGCQVQAEGVRRYEEAATRLYLASGRVPQCLSARRHSL